MKFTKNDVTQMENLMKALKRAKFELEGLEVLALADLIKWAAKLGQAMQIEVQQQEAEKSAPLTPAAEPTNKIIEALPKPNRSAKNKKAESSS